MGRPDIKHSIASPTCRRRRWQSDADTAQSRVHRCGSTTITDTAVDGLLSGRGMLDLNYIERMATKNRPPGGVTRRTALTTLSAAAALTLTPDLVSGQDGRRRTRRSAGAGSRMRSARDRPRKIQGAPPFRRAHARRCRISTARLRLPICITSVTTPACRSSTRRRTASRSTAWSIGRSRSRCRI